MLHRYCDVAAILLQASVPSTGKSRTVIFTRSWGCVSVLAVPEVRVTPQFQSKRPKRTAKMRCHVVGEPLPRVRWLKNDKPLSEDPPDKYQVIGNGTKLLIKKVDYADTGAYMCEATSAGGLTRDISSLVIQEQPTPSKSDSSL